MAVMQLTWICFLAICVQMLLADFQTGNTHSKYCQPALCPRGKKHIGCKNNGNLGKYCPHDAQLLNLSELHTTILREHNTLRNQLASGKLYDFPAPERMATLQWNDELATLAELNVKQCKLASDQCHNTEEFHNSGQILAMLNTTDANRTDEELLKESIEGWWKQWEHVKLPFLEHFPTNRSGNLLQNFAIMARHNNTHIGCAVMKFSKDALHHFYLACNYAGNYIPGQPIYQIKSINCQSGYDNTYPALCKAEEQYVNLNHTETTTKSP